jgi:hypothetical protein
VVVAAVVVLAGAALVEVGAGSVVSATVVVGDGDDVVGSPSGSPVQAANKQPITINERRIVVRVRPACIKVAAHATRSHRIRGA